jgi:(p)ppGpp synthase/HD superfamily hydrolase
VNLEAAKERVAKLAREHGLDAPLLERVLGAAWRAHDGQKRKSGAPYIVHPIRVAVCVAEELRSRETDLVAAALLHDCVEDTPLTLDGVEALAGPRVRALVDLLTKPAIEDKKELDRVYFARLRAGDAGASLVKCADRIDNLRDMAGSGWSDAKKRSYIAEARDKILPVAREKAPAAASVLERIADEVASAL